MCGIIGYVGKKAAVPYLIEGLSRLEYRGYDSAGIAVCEGEKLVAVKKSGKLGELKKALLSVPALCAVAGIGHTRWATHGSPTDRNAHPQLSEHGVFAVVHNGIIENHGALKKELELEGVTFSSETDTEVVSAMLEKLYAGDLTAAVFGTLSRLEGSFALAVLCRERPNCMVCAARSSPLVVGKGEDGIFAASDAAAIAKYVQTVYRLSPGEIAVADESGLRFFRESGKETEKTAERLNIEPRATEKGGFAHFMLKEIFEQPEVFERTVRPRIKGKKVVFEELSSLKDELRFAKRMVIVACGSAYHAGITGKYIIEKLARLPVEVDIASEFRYRRPILDERTVVVAVSQSGETADTLAAVRLAKDCGARVISVVNVIKSSIALESDAVIYTAAGPEIAVATTKAFCSQLAVLYLLAAYIAAERREKSEEETFSYLEELLTLCENIRAVLENLLPSAKETAHWLSSREHVYFIGRGMDYAAAAEGSLKLKEISYIHSESYAAGELKHGTLSLVEKGTAVIALACCEELFSKTASNIEEVLARKASVLVLTTEKHRNDFSAERTVVLPNVSPAFCALQQVVFLQLVSYYTALLRGCDIDKPRNLAKSVTVE